MQVRRQDCRTSSKPLVVFVPKYGFVQIREGSWGGRLPFPDLRAHDPLCACRRLPMLFCRGTFSMSSFGRDDPSHLSMSLHMELNRTYGTSRIACFIWRHTSSIALRSGTAGRQKLQLHAVQAPDLPPDEFRPVLRRAVGYHQDLPEPFACGLQELDKLLPGKGVCISGGTPPPPSSVIRPNTMVLECDPVYV